jgi:hypothetical protein
VILKVERVCWCKGEQNRRSALVETSAIQAPVALGRSAKRKEEKKLIWAATIKLTWYLSDWNAPIRDKRESECLSSSGRDNLEEGHQSSCSRAGDKTDQGSSKARAAGTTGWHKRGAKKEQGDQEGGMETETYQHE